MFFVPFVVAQNGSRVDYFETIDGSKLKIKIVSDFRQNDLKFGGEGAPLVPIFHKMLVNHLDLDGNTIFINLGGISNLTYVPSRGRLKAYDTGPGMSLIDECVRKFWGEEYDKNGKYSSQGKIVEDMLDYLINDASFIIKTPPKSTGREDFGEKYLKKIIKRNKNFSPFDIFLKLVWHKN